MDTASSSRGSDEEETINLTNQAESTEIQTDNASLHPGVKVSYVDD